MNNDLEQFSEERLKEIANEDTLTNMSFEELLALARIALAAKQAKPIGIYNQQLFNLQGSAVVLNIDKSVEAGFVSDDGELSSSRGYLYTTPQPANTEQDNPVAWLLSGGGTKNIVSFDSGNAYADPSREVTPLYTTPQTRHAGLVSWIECSERMPETYLNVLLTDEADDMCIGQLESHDDTDFFVVGCPRYKATHWMPRPATPKPESE